MSDVEHYRQRLRALLKYATHTQECAHTKWRVADYIQKQYGTGYSAGPEAACTCGCAALAAIVHAEVGTIEDPYPSVQVSTAPEVKS